MEEKSSSKTVTGLPENTEAALAYILGWVSGLVLFLLQKDHKKIRFHALQSIVLFGACHVISMGLGMIPVVGWAILPFFGIATFVLWLVMIVKTYQGGTMNIPFVTDFVKKQLGYGLE